MILMFAKIPCIDGHDVYRSMVLVMAILPEKYYIKQHYTLIERLEIPGLMRVSHHVSNDDTFGVFYSTGGTSVCHNQSLFCIFEKGIMN